MSTYAYRLDVLSPNRRAGDTLYLMATSKAAALRVFAAEHPEMVEWTVEATKIPKEEMPMATELPVLVIPPITELVPGVDEENPSFEHRDSYAEQSLALIHEALMEQKRSGVSEPRLLVQFPEDTTEEGNDSRDTVMLDRHDTVVVIDPGVR